ncbi:Glutamyl-tRNA reductase-binding protein, chloroplastic [Linum perenne]
MSILPSVRARPISHFHSSSFTNHRYPSLPKLSSLRCSVSAPVLDAPLHKPFPAEVSRTILELSSVTTLSAITEQGWPLSIGVPFAVDDEDGTPVLCLPGSHRIVTLGHRYLNILIELLRNCPEPTAVRGFSSFSLQGQNTLILSAKAVGEPSTLVLLLLNSDRAYS